MPSAPPTRVALAWIVVILTVFAVWKFVDYRNQPPELKEVISGQ